MLFISILIHYRVIINYPLINTISYEVVSPILTFYSSTIFLSPCSLKRSPSFTSGMYMNITLHYITYIPLREYKSTSCWYNNMTDMPCIMMAFSMIFYPHDLWIIAIASYQEACMNDALHSIGTTSTAAINYVAFSSYLRCIHRYAFLLVFWKQTRASHLV